MNFGTGGYQPLTTALASASKGRAAAFGFHARTETKLALTSPFRGLISSFHVGQLLEMKSLEFRSGGCSCQT
jgi:hypothetical protein